MYGAIIMKKTANIKQLVSGELIMNPTARVAKESPRQNTSILRFSKTLLASLFVLSFLNACTEGNDNVTPGSIRQGNSDSGEPIVPQGSPDVDQFVNTVYNGKDTSGKKYWCFIPEM